MVHIARCFLTDFKDRPSHVTTVDGNFKKINFLTFSLVSAAFRVFLSLAVVQVLTPGQAVEFCSSHDQCLFINGKVNIYIR